MKRRKKTQRFGVKAMAAVPGNTEYNGLKELLRQAGLIDEKNEPTLEGKRCLKEGVDTCY